MAAAARSAAGAARRARLGRQRHAHQRPQPLDRARAARAVAVDAGRKLRQHPARAARRRRRDCWRDRAAVTHLGDELADFADTAAVLALCRSRDRVDTSVAHLAGALGRPTCGAAAVLAGLALDARSRRSPWYPAVRLFRQPAIGDWASVIARVRAELAAIAA